MRSANAAMVRDGWAVGMAVKNNATDLALALQEAINQLGDNGELGKLFAAGKLRWKKP